MLSINQRQSSSKADRDRVFASSIHSDNARSGYQSNENGQNAESPIQNLSQICDEILAEQDQDVVEAASERISVEREREDTEEELTGQDV